MKHLDIQVIQKGLEWLEADHPVWLCTVLATFGSAPREPGSMLVALSTGVSCGSLSGGCVEDDFLERLAAGEFDTRNQVVRYGDGGLAPTLSLPCGGVLDVLIEYFPSDELSKAHFQALDRALKGSSLVTRAIKLNSHERSIKKSEINRPRVSQSAQGVEIEVGPAKRLIIAGLSPVAEFCAQFAITLGFEVIICDPRADQIAKAEGLFSDVQVLETLPAVFIAGGGCHAATAVVALTHDPRIDDLTMMESIRTDAFYIGAMGSIKTSLKRKERLARIGQLTDVDMTRIHAPIGLRLGSKTPSEIAIAVMADILRVGNGIERCRL
jgi:xanthine dehydrogenase accessory factor